MLAILSWLTASWTASCGGGSGDDAPPCDACAGQDEAGAGSAIVPPDRLPLPGTWESAGVEGGIPERAAICADVTEPPYQADPTGTSSAVAAIQAAIDDCPADQVVYVPAGTHRIDDAITIRKAISLRGAGTATVCQVVHGGTAIHIGGLGPWPPPKANPDYRTPIADGATRGSTTVSVTDAAAVEVGKMVMIDEEDAPDLVWTKGDSPGHYRASMHMVEPKTATTVTFRPALPIDFTRSPQRSWFPDLVEGAGVEAISFVGTNDGPGLFIDITSPRLLRLARLASRRSRPSDHRRSDHHPCGLSLRARHGSALISRRSRPRSARPISASWR